MIEPDEIVLRSMMYINVTKETQPFMEWLRKSLQEGREATDNLLMSDVVLRQVQGGNACLKLVIQNIEMAFDTHRSRIANKTLDESAGKAL